MDEEGRTYTAALGRGVLGPGEMVRGVPYGEDGRAHEFLKRRQPGEHDAEYTHWQRAQTDDGSGIVAYDYRGSSGRRDEANMPVAYELPPRGE
jgi:hypothetical protein